jgi:GGDEF domain-containing protein
MLGSLLTLAGLALSDALISRTGAAVRNLAFVLLAGASSVLMSGLPEALFPGMAGRGLLVAKATVGSLSGAMALYFLGNWLGGVREDARVYQLTVWGAAAVALAAVVLGAVASQVALDHYQAVLLGAAIVNMVPVLMAVIAVRRAAQRGDPLAQWMLVAVACLAVMVSGLYLKGLGLPGLGLAAWLITALATVAFFLLACGLVLLRNHQNRQLARLSRLETGVEPATGLATGGTLLSKMEHVFWRTARQQGECTVICLYLSNLYELSDTLGPGVEHQILKTMAARVRRGAGFRGLVGLYHPRCFVVVVSADRHNPPLQETLDWLRSNTDKPLSVQNSRKGYALFKPLLGVGVVRVDPANALAMDVLNEAERRALALVHTPDIETERAGLSSPTLLD